MTVRTASNCCKYYQVCFCRLLEGQDGGRLEPEVVLEVLGNLQGWNGHSNHSQRSTSFFSPAPTSRTRRWKGIFLINKSVDFWYRLSTSSVKTQEHRAPHLISRRATVPGRYLCGLLTPPQAGVDFRATKVASCLRGAFPPVDRRAVCLVRAISPTINTERPKRRSGLATPISPLWLGSSLGLFLSVIPWALFRGVLHRQPVAVSLSTDLP